MKFNASSTAVHSFRTSTVANQPLNLPKTTICRFCNKTEHRGCMKNGRCRECYQGRSA